jgi:hypothetical protein
VGHVDPQRPRLARHAQAEAEADIDLRPLSTRLGQRMAGTRDVAEQRDAHARGPSSDGGPFELHPTVRQNPAEDAALYDPSAGQRMCSQKHATRVADVGSRPDSQWG